MSAGARTDKPAVGKAFPGGWSRLANGKLLGLILLLRRP